MVYILIDEMLFNFETDIREMVMAFFPFQEYKCISSICEYDDNCDEKSNFLLNLLFLKDYNKVQLDRKTNRNEIKRDLYFHLLNITKKSLKWGTLTGIRPVNIINEEYLSKNTKIDKKSCRKYLEKEYLISNEKANVLIDIASVEREVLNRTENKFYQQQHSIYVGVPFCKSRCLYCSFASHDISKCMAEADQYLISLEKEFQINSINIPNDKGILSVYIGGGTPTALNEKQFDTLLSIINTNVIKNVKDKKIEYTVEAGRPDTINKEKLQIMKHYNVNRISINPQTFNQRTLDIIGRKHTVQDVIEKYYLSREIGFDNINMDIILGLPGETFEDVLNTVCEIAKLKPDSFTIHSLALKRAARLNTEKNEWMNRLCGLKEDPIEIQNMMTIATYTASKLQMRPYYLYRQKNIAGNLENIGFSLKGKECVYNIVMMDEKQSVYGFGCGASSKIVRYEQNSSNGNLEKIISREEGFKSVYVYNKYWRDVNEVH